MKKVLFATTALVAFSGAAVADVAVSGRAEMGVFGGDGIETQFFTDIDVTFTMSGETDGGLIFGAAVDLDEGGVGAPAVADNSEDGGVAIFISGDFGTVTMGDTDGALDWAMTEAGNIGNPGSIADDETAHGGYLGAPLDAYYDNQILRYDYAVGDFGVAVSIEMDETGTFDPGFAIGARYTFAFAGGSVQVGGGYQQVDGPGVFRTGSAIIGGATAIGVSAVVTLDNGLTAGGAYTLFEDDTGFQMTHFGIGAGYSIDAISIHANYGMFEDDIGREQSGFGLAAAYDLGGGLVVHLGYGSSDSNYFGGPTAATWSFGVGMSF